MPIAGNQKWLVPWKLRDEVFVLLEARLVLDVCEERPEDFEGLDVLGLLAATAEIATRGANACAAAGWTVFAGSEAVASALGRRAMTVLEARPESTVADAGVAAARVVRAGPVVPAWAVVAAWAGAPAPVRVRVAAAATADTDSMARSRARTVDRARRRGVVISMPRESMRRRTASRGRSSRPE